MRVPATGSCISYLESSPSWSCPLYRWRTPVWSPSFILSTFGHRDNAIDKTTPSNRLVILSLFPFTLPPNTFIIMKFAKSSIVALLAPVVAARFTESNEGNNVQLYPSGFYEESSEKYLVELGPGDTRWVTEDEKWELRRVSSLALLRQQLSNI